jgi:hypothetical protein
VYDFESIYELTHSH